MQHFRRARHGLWTLVLSAALAAVLGGRAAAQDAPLPTPDGFEPFSGLEYGGFDFFFRLQAGMEATDNIRQDPSMHSDLKAIVNATAVARSNWKKHALAFTAGHSRQDAVETANQKSEATSATVSGRLDLTEELSFRAGLLHVENIVGRNDPLEFSGNLNGVTVTDTVEAGLAWDGKDYFAHLEGRYSDVDNTTDVAVTVLSRIQQQDREEVAGTLQVGRNFPWGKVYVLGGAQHYDYSGSAVILPEDRDSVGVRGGVGLEFKHGDLQGTFRLIGFSQEFDAPTIGAATDVVGTAQLVWQATDDLAFAARAERSFDEINIQTSAGLFTDLAAVGLLYRLLQDRPRLSLLRDRRHDRGGGNACARRRARLAGA